MNRFFFSRKHYPLKLSIVTFLVLSLVLGIIPIDIFTKSPSLGLADAKAATKQNPVEVGVFGNLKF